jgi:hypothetical protein
LYQRVSSARAAPLAIRNATHAQSKFTSVFKAIMAAAMATMMAPANNGAGFWKSESISAA